MSSPRWSKILRDLWSNKARTLLVILSISLGIAAIGIVLGAQIIIGRELPASYQKINPASATISCDPFTDDLLQVIAGIDGVAQVEGRRVITARVRIGAQEWRDLQLNVIPDSGVLSVNIVRPVSGVWPPPEREVLVERGSLSLTNAAVGSQIEILTPEGKTRSMRIAGLAHDLNQPSGTFTNQINGYITFQTLEWLGYSAAYNEVLLVVSGDTTGKAHIQEVSARVRDKIEKSGREVYYTTVPEPGQHWFQPFLLPMTAILGVLGALSLLLSCFLVINTISALLAQQVRQIGIMKAIGARRYQIVSLYLASVLLIGLAALVIALPASQAGLRALVRLLTGFMNFDITNTALPTGVILTQVILSLLIPLLAALPPVTGGTSVTVRQAINDYGISQNAANSGTFDRLLTRIQGMPRPILLSIRNTFRRKSRLILTLLTLALSSMIFVSVMSVYGSLLRTLDQALSYYGFDIVVFFNRPYRIEQIQNHLKQVSGITTSENWGVANARRLRQDGTESDNILLVAPPVGTKLINPTLLKGRWLVAYYKNALVINSDVLRMEPDLDVDSEITMKVDGEKTTWRVVGIVQSVLVGPWAYTNYPYYARKFNRVGTASAVYLVTEQHTAEYQAEVARNLESYFDRVGLRVSSISQLDALRSTMIVQFNVLIVFLLLMALILAVVGGLGLAGTMSLNVIERTREIGIMRAIGASNGSVMQIFISEGVLIGLISWVLGTLLSIPAGRVLSDLVGNGFLQSPLNYAFSLPGAGLWLAAMIVISVLASFFPALSAVRLTVRNVLAYE